MFTNYLKSFASVDISEKFIKKMSLVFFNYLYQVWQ